MATHPQVYEIGDYRETVEGPTFHAEFIGRLDCDAQAEAHARRIASDTGARGYFIRRDDAKWWVGA